MWNPSSSQCKICYKLCDVNEFVEQKTPSEQEHSEEDRRKVLNLCSEYLFSELCDSKSISCKESLPFCVECFGVIAQIEILDEKCKIQKTDIAAFSDQFAVKVLRLRNRRGAVEEFPKIIGGVTIKQEKGVGEETKCKICHGNYNEKPMSANESLNLTMVANVIRTCKKYLFSEIFDDGSLDVHLIARNNILPFCFECCISIQDLCQKSDLIDTTVTEIESVVNTFAVKILNYRKNRKSIISNSDETVVNFSVLTPDNSFRDAETPAVTVVEEPESDDECMVVDVIPMGVRNVFDSLCSKLKIKKEVIETPPQETYAVNRAFPGIQTSPEKTSFNKEVQPPRACNFPFPVLSGPVIIESSGNGVKESRTGQNSSSSENSKKCDGNGQTISEETPGPSSANIAVNRPRRGGNYKCQNCGAVFLQNMKWLQHIDTCFEGGNLFECETCGQCFSDSFYFQEHVKSHEVINSAPTTAPPVGIVKATPAASVFDYPKVGLVVGGDPFGPYRRPVKATKSYKCNRCNRVFSAKNHLSNHRRGQLCFPENRPDLLLAALSRKRVRGYKKSNSIRQKQKYGKDGRQFSCRMCPLTFVNQLLYTSHLQTHFDTSDPEKRCNICRKVFTTKGNRNCHFYKRHPEKLGRLSKKGNFYDIDEIPVLVPEVNGEKQETSAQASSPKKPAKRKRIRFYPCVICKERFLRKSLLRKHILMHHQENSANSNSTEPQNVDDDPEYSPVRPRTTKSAKSKVTLYTCAICGNRFRKIMELRSHLQSHYDEAPYRCTSCQKVLTNQRTLDRHMDSVHSFGY